MLIKKLGRAALMLALTVLAACDPQRVRELEEGVSTEADVRQRFGAPENIWDGAGGERIFEYNRQPSGHQNFMIGIGPDGKMTSLRQVLNPRTFAQVQPGMAMEEVRRLLGKPMKKTPYALKNEIAWDWRYLEPPNTSMVFTVWFNPDYRVLRTSSAPDPEALEHRGR
ncbi:outer membrane protein assembly factor BamE domain-containing protein [Ramlibacter sp.]|uniref:outer membrane protein assembly factor BamE domain-containing protein n=1 Tax=Ramlibacter sp. TaxID=1917967 RepID=UPI002BA7C2E4|nr:outer membrane protein assembly factor BamE [Ramlibacter sp.]HWI82844.1 outer membrane protein assembly factor BamE [Ramlibacter sp.]